MLANSAATLPRGHALIETYLFEQIQGKSRIYGSLTYLLYGVTDRVTIGFKPMFGVAAGKGSPSNVNIGDLALTAQYRLTSLTAPIGSPTISVAVQRSFPTGRYDELDTRPATGLGSGAGATTLSLYGQQYFRLSNGHLFRGRVNLSRTFAESAHVDGESVFGTHSGFQGHAKPGHNISAGVSGEYSLNRHWVIALDIVHDRTGAGSVSGEYPALAPAPSRVSTFRLKPSRSFALAPALEYSFNANLGILVGTRFRLRGHNSAPSITPAVAINYVH